MKKKFITKSFWVLLCLAVVGACCTPGWLAAKQADPYDYREENFLHSPDFAAYQQLVGNGFEADALHTDLNGAVRLALYSLPDFYAMVRDDCVNEKARSPTDYVWVIPWRHGSQTAYRLLTYQNGSYRLDTRGKESARTYAFTQPGMVNGLLQQYELEQPDFLAVLRVDKCYLYVQKQERQVFIPFYLEQNAAGEPVDVTRMITMDSMRRAVVQEAAALYRQCQSDPYLRLYYYFGGRHDPIVYLEAAQSMLGTS